MEQEKILALILNKLENIEKEQKEMKKEQQEMKKEQLEMKEEILKRLDSVEKAQKGIQQYAICADDTFKKFEEDHQLIERLKKAVGE